MWNEKKPKMVKLSLKQNDYKNSYQLFAEVVVASGGYLAAKRQGKYQPLATDTEVNSCFSIY